MALGHIVGDPLRGAFRTSGTSCGTARFLRRYRLDDWKSSLVNADQFDSLVHGVGDHLVRGDHLAESLRQNSNLVLAGDR